MWSAAWCSGSASATITSSSSAFCTSSQKPYSLAAVHMGRWEVKMDLRCQHSNVLKSPNQISVIFTHPLRSLSQMYNVFPWLMEWLPGRHHKMFDKLEKVRQFTMEKIKEHQDTLDPSSPRDYIDCFLMRLHQVRQRLQPGLGNQIISFFPPLRLSFCISIPSGKASTNHRVHLRQPGVDSVESVFGRNWNHQLNHQIRAECADQIPKNPG